MSPIKNQQPNVTESDVTEELKTGKLATGNVVTGALGAGNVVTGVDLWRSLDEVANTEEFRQFVAKEFPTHAPEVLEGASRRNFLKVMGASLALAGMGGLTGCLRYPREKILPFASRPEGRIPGVAVHYATALEKDGVSQALLATTFDGRPIKVDGNPDHPMSLGTLDVTGQGSVLELYDPARSREVVHDKKASTWAAARDALRRAHAAGGMAVLAAPSSSPTVRRMRDRFLKAGSGAQWVEFCPLSRDAEREGTKLLFGSPYRPIYDFSKARLVVTLDADPLMTHPAALAHSRGFAAARVARRETSMFQRTVAIESRFSVTGSVADQRITARAGDIAGIAARIAGALNASLIPADLTAAFASAGNPTPAEVALARDLNAQRGGVLVIAGDHQPAEVHALAHLLNVALEGVGSTVQYSQDIDPTRTSHADQITKLVGDIDAGRVKSVLIMGGNPVFDAPADSGLAGALSKVATRFRLGEYQDETSNACQWHLPQAHYLETWLDGHSWDGTLTLTQPMIEALYGGRNAAEVVGLILDETPKSAYDLVRETVASSATGDFETFWREAIHRGFLENSAFRADSPRPDGGWGAALTSRVTASSGASDVEIIFVGDYTLHDGCHANNGWLQECPDPMTKIAWDNAAIVAPADAEQFGVKKNGDLVTVTVGSKSVTIAAFVLPGQTPGTVTLPVGYGRDVFDRVAGGVSYNLAKGSGVDVYPLRTVAAMKNGFALGTVKRASGHYKLATTQDHNAIHSIEQVETERRASQFARIVDLGEYKQKHGASVKALAGHVPHLESLFDEHSYHGHKWGMGIDLDLCTGCSACVIACQAENNIAVTGKDEVAYGREMHWIRIDRYFRGNNYDNPEVIHQPLTCHHCENAPCEQVCPVAATVHSAEGLNDMVYNRCIGTRYCSNNCPYKVRRFNYFNNAKHPSEQEQMVYNPEVTVRARGVMEKCTYCVQRINQAKISAKNENRAVRDGDAIPACAQTCPTQAITFGDLADAHSQVSEAHASDRSYAMLEELNVKPRTHYLARVVNSPREGS